MNTDCSSSQESLNGDRSDNEHDPIDEFVEVDRLEELHDCGFGLSVRFFVWKISMQRSN